MRLAVLGLVAGVGLLVIGVLGYFGRAGLPISYVPRGYFMSLLGFSFVGSSRRGVVRGGVSRGGVVRGGFLRGALGALLVGLLVAGCTAAPKQSTVDLFPSSSVSASPSVVGGPTPMPSGVRIDVSYGSLPKTLTPDQAAVVGLMQTYHEIFYGLYYDEKLLKDFSAVASYVEVQAAKKTVAGLKQRNELIVGSVGVDVLDVTLTGETGGAVVCNNFSDWHTYKKGNPIKYAGTVKPEEAGYLMFVKKVKGKWIVDSVAQQPKCGV